MGLLQVPKANNVKFAVAIAAEFIGTMIFALYGNATPAEWGPWGNGITLAVLIYITANLSGGHLNPAVTLATIFTGHIDLLKGLCYIIAQIGGACVGSLLTVALLTNQNIAIGMGATGPGCFTPKTSFGITADKAFGWEVIMTFVLVSTVYAVAVGEPSYGNIGPLAIGFSLWSSGFIGSQYTGTALNPARVLGTSIVFNCYWNNAWVYVLAELAGGVVAGLLAWPLYGTGPSWKKMMKSFKGVGKKHNHNHHGAHHAQHANNSMFDDVHGPQAGLNSHGDQYASRDPHLAVYHGDNPGVKHPHGHRGAATAGITDHAATTVNVADLLNAAHQEGYMSAKNIRGAGVPTGGLMLGGRGVVTEGPGPKAQQRPMG